MFVKDMAVTHKEELLEKVYDNVQNAIIVANAKSKIVFANTPGLALFGYEEDEVMGQSIDMLSAKPGEGLVGRKISYYLHRASTVDQVAGRLAQVPAGSRRRPAHRVGVPGGRRAHHVLSVVPGGVRLRL